MMNKKIAVVILNWNGVEHLKRFLPMLIDRSENLADIIVADNGSTDYSKQFLKSLPNVSVIELSRNFGFAGGYNRALQHLSHDYFVILNSDVEVSPGWLTNVVATFEEDKLLSCFQPKILDYKERNRFEYAGGCGGYIDKYGYAFCRGRIFKELENDNSQYNDESEIFWATGACMIIRGEAFHSVGGFDGDLFAHFEEIDLCWRLKNAGWKIKVVPSITVWHVGGGTLDAASPFKTYLNFRNSLLVLHKNLPKGIRFPTLLSRLVLDGIAALKLLFSGDIKHFLAVFKAHFHFYGRLKSNAAKRTGNEKLDHPEVLNGNLVWLYYIQKLRTFSAIKERGKFFNK